MKRQLAVLGACLALLVTSACGDSGEGSKTTKITFGYIADFSGAATIAAATDQDLWEKQGLEVDTKVFTNGPLQIQALGAGDLDFGYIGPGALWLPASGKARIVAVNMLGQADRVITRPGTGITDVAGLKGKKVGVPEGTSGDMILSLALTKAGLKATDVTRVAMDPSTVVTAFSSGQVDAAAIWYPLIDTIKQRVPDLVELAGTQDFYPQTTFPSAFVTQQDLPTKDPETVKKVQTVLQQANDWVVANPDEALQTTAEFVKAPPGQMDGATKHVKMLTSAELAKLTEDGTVAGWFSGLADVFVQMGKLPSSPDPKQYYTGDLYVAATKRGAR